MWVNLIFLFYKPKASAREAGSHTVEQEPAKQQKGKIKPELFENDIAVGRLTLSQPPYRVLIS